MRNKPHNNDNQKRKRKPLPRSGAAKTATVTYRALRYLVVLLAPIVATIALKLARTAKAYRTELAPAVGAVVAAFVVWKLTGALGGLGALASGAVGAAVGYGLAGPQGLGFWTAVKRADAKARRADEARADIVGALWENAAVEALVTDRSGEPLPLLDVRMRAFGDELTIELGGGRDLGWLASNAKNLLAAFAPLGTRDIVVVAAATPGQALVLLISDLDLFIRPVAEWALLENQERNLVWERAALSCGIASGGIAAKLLDVEVHDNAVRLTLVVPAGRTFDELRRDSIRLAPLLGAFSSTARPVPAEPSYAHIDLVINDVLSEPLGAWPGLTQTARFRVGDQFPVGITELGDVATMSMVSKHLLSAGLTGSGKSVSLQAALAPYLLATRSDGTAAVQLAVIDPKLVEFGRYKDIAYRTVVDAGDEIPVMDKALSLLRDLNAEMRRRQSRLATANRNEWSPDIDGEDPDMPFIILVVDELADLTTDRKRGAEFNDAFGHILRKGRALGICVFAATQRPNGQVIPPATRDQFLYRWCHRVADANGTEIVLGPEGRLCGAYSIPQGLTGAGVGYLSADGGGIDKLRSYYLTPADLTEIVRRASAIPGRVTDTSDPAPTEEPQPAPKPAAATPATPPAETPTAAAAPVTTDDELVRAPLGSSRFKMTNRFISDYRALRGKGLTTHELRDELTTMLGPHLGTVAPIAGTFEGAPVRVYDLGAMLLVVAANNTRLLAVRTGTVTDLLDPQVAA